MKRITTCIASPLTLFPSHSVSTSIPHKVRSCGVLYMHGSIAFTLDVAFRCMHPYMYLVTHSYLVWYSPVDALCEGNRVSGVVQKTIVSFPATQDLGNIKCIFEYKCSELEQT